MVLCWVALPVLAILGIFSAKYRKLTRESLECLFKSVTLQRCSSGLDDRIKSRISGMLLKVSPGSARFFYKYYKVVSFILLILFLWSLYVSAVGVYNYVEYGNCNGPDSDGFCILDPTGVNSATCEIPGAVSSAENVTYPTVDTDFPILGNPDAELTVIEYGCYVCPYTNEAEETVLEVLEYYDGRVNWQFREYPLPGHAYSYESTLAVLCANEQGAYAEYHEAMFAQEMNFANETFNEIATSLGLDVEQFDVCMTNKTYDSVIEKNKATAIAAGVKGTPTFFIGEQVIVGPKPFKTFKKLINEELAS